MPISYYGKYFIRSGSTLLELSGSALTEFLLRRTGKTWDDIIEANATIKDLDEDSINKFINDSKKAKRINTENDISVQSLLTKLRLIENKKIKRAAIVLFGKDPSKFYPNLHLKIGRFGSNDSDLRFHEVLEHNLIELRYLIPEVLNSKFFKHPIDFIGLQRFESDEYPVEAIREMILNALVHRSYLGSFTQIKVFDNKIEIWNDGGLPEGITEDNLRHSHASKPRNPIIADVFFKAGYIDTWGRGTITIIESCKLSNLPEPILIEKNGGFLVSISKNKYTREILEQMGLNKRQLKAIEFIKTNVRITNKEYQGINDCARNTASNDLKDLVERNLLKSSDIKGAGSFYQLY
jgi:ATP-dependent DNA helicase RecG